MTTTELLRQKVKSLEVELSEARNALEYVLRVEREHDASPNPPHVRIAVSQPIQNSLSLTGAVKIVLMANPNAATAVIMDNVKQMIPDAKRHSIRSLISQMKKKEREVETPSLGLLFFESLSWNRNQESGTRRIRRDSVLDNL